MLDFSYYASFKLHTHVASTMKYICSKAKCFTAHIYCSRNQTIKHKFKGSKNYLRQVFYSTEWYASIMEIDSQSECLI